MHLFVYGSLVDPRRLDEVLGTRFLGERLRARLAGYERVTVPTFDYPFLIAREGSTVEGVLIRDLDAKQLADLDRYEEVESGLYSRASVDVEAWGCGPRLTFVAAQTYVAGPVLQRLMESAAAQTRPSTAS